MHDARSPNPHCRLLLDVCHVADARRNRSTDFGHHADGRVARLTDAVRRGQVSRSRSDHRGLRSNRSERQQRNDPERQPAAVGGGVANGGVASVRYDKRGVGESAGALIEESKLVFHDLVNDAKAWLTLLAADKRFTKVIVIGHSEGATIGLLAAQQNGVRAYVSVAGPAMSAAQILRSQLAGKLPPDLAEKSEQMLVSLESGKTASDVPQQLMVLYRPSVQPYLIDWFKIIPTDEIKKLHMPCLILQGDTDIQVPVTAAQALHDANPKAQLIIVEGMNHVLKLVPSDQAKQLASYRDPSLPLAPIAGQSILQFIAEH
jgi:uncharacterized protein